MYSSRLFFDAFKDLPDPRKDINKKHLFGDILFITICAIISGITGWEEIEDFARDREDWLGKYIELPNGIPSHDVIRHVFLFLDSKSFIRCFAKWTQKIQPILEKSHIAIDGKTSRRSGSKKNNLKTLHTVSAWASKQKLSLGQISVNDKSNEITAIPELLDILEIKGCLVTIDAMGCQKDIAKNIVEKKADYVLAVKRNQKHLYEEITDYFNEAKDTNFQDIKYMKYRTTEKDHGRIEKRTYYITCDIKDLFEIKKWQNLKTIIMVVSERKTDKGSSLEKRYFISSLEGEVNRIVEAIRNHWGIENSLHWLLDVQFGEDQCRKRIKNAPKNMALLRKMALNILRTETEFKAGIKRKMLKAARNTRYLEKLLQL